MTPIKRLLQVAIVLAIAVNIALVIWLPTEGVPPIANVVAVVLCSFGLWILSTVRT